MIQSMTGFASKTIMLEPEGNKIKLSISIKALNSRYFDISCKMPYILNQFEPDFIKLVKSKLNRGQIYLIIHSSDQNLFRPSIEPAMSNITGYIEALNKIQKKFELPGKISIEDVLRLPDIFILEEKGIDENCREMIFNAISHLLDEVVIERKREGQKLEQDLLQRASIMDQKINQLETIFERTITEQKEKISHKISELNKNVDPILTETQRQTLYLQLDKMDIHEEIVRFKTHLQNINALIKSQAEEKGKQLDFTLQELFREINTITAKTPNSQIIELAIAIKVELEKMREQVQNIV